MHRYRTLPLGIAFVAGALQAAGCFNVGVVAVDAGGGTGGAAGETGGAGVHGSGGVGAATGGTTGSGGGGASAGTGGRGMIAGSGGAPGGGGTTGSGGRTGSGSGGAPAGGSGGAGAAAACGVVIDPLAHHLGDGIGTEGTSLSRTFTIGCACNQPWLSFQISGPNYELAPRITLNGQALPSLQAFFPPFSASGIWQVDAGNTHDYNGYIQVRYDVTGRLVAGANTFTITNGTIADDYDFSDVRLECGAPTAPPGPDIVTRGGWVGTFPDRSEDDPLGIQGAFYGFGDGVSCAVPTNVCASGACCLTGATREGDPAVYWGCGIGLDLRSTGGTAATQRPYTGPATCFILELTGTSGGNPVTVSARSYLDMNGKTAPTASLGAVNGDTTKRVCFADLACPATAPATACAVTGSWYNLQLNVVGGTSAGAFGICLRSLIPVP